MSFRTRFIPDFAEITKYIVGMMSENQIFKRKEEAKKAFEEVKKAIAHALTLINLDFKKDLIMYCYAFEHTMSGILLQKNELNEEVPIAFMSIPLKKHELNYSLVEKKAFAVVKAVKHFRYYVLHSHSIVVVPNPNVKSILTQQEVGRNNRATWVSKVQEFDVDI